jgi:type I restriction enzyme M protein
MGIDYTKYYTPVALSTELIKLLDLKNNSTIVDICCGTGNLLNAALKKNNSVYCVGVDVNEVQLDKHIAIHQDGRKYAIEHKGKYDFSIANPPFGKAKTESYSASLYTGIYSGISSGRVEIEMLIANLMVLKDNGTMLIILPSTVVNGHNSINIRKVIARNHTIHVIVDLPKNAFSPERVKCSALIIGKTSNSKKSSTQYYRIEENLQMIKKHEISAQSILSGSWMGDYQIHNSSFTIKQGGISSNYFCSEGEIELLHTGKKSNAWQPTRKQSKLPDERSCIKADNGDIIISRIGASAGQKCVYKGDPIYISDCLMIIKAPTAEILERITALDLTLLAKGLSTPYIAAYDVYRMYNAAYVQCD